MSHDKDNPISNETGEYLANVANGHKVVSDLPVQATSVAHLDKTDAPKVRKIFVKK